MCSLTCIKHWFSTAVRPPEGDTCDVPYEPAVGIVMVTRFAYFRQFLDQNFQTSSHKIFKYLQLPENFPGFRGFQPPEISSTSRNFPQVSTSRHFQVYQISTLSAPGAWCVSSCPRRICRSGPGGATRPCCCCGCAPRPLPRPRRPCGRRSRSGTAAPRRSS